MTKQCSGKVGNSIISLDFSSVDHLFSYCLWSCFFFFLLFHTTVCDKLLLEFDDNQIILLGWLKWIKLEPFFFFQDTVWVPGPFLVYGVLSVVGALVSIVFPETRNKKLPETLEEAENFGKWVFKVVYCDYS